MITPMQGSRVGKPPVKSETRIHERLSGEVSLDLPVLRRIFAFDTQFICKDPRMLAQLEVGGKILEECCRSAADMHPGLPEPA
jgi:hypothetical protein